MNRSDMADYPDRTCLQMPWILGLLLRAWVWLQNLYLILISKML